jgi:hypothetical protein
MIHRLRVVIGLCLVLVALPAGAEVTGNGASSAAASFALPCLDDSGAVKNASSGEVCKAILPKCSVLLESTKKKVLNMLQWKIWGYYKGKDLDLQASSTSNFVGDDLPNPICSVVGHKLKGGSVGQYELAKQSVGDLKSCGILPRGGAQRSPQYVQPIFEAGDPAPGSLWSAYMQGAYPWVIRREASDLLKAISPDLSNVGSLVATAAMNQDFAATMTKMRDFTNSLSAEARQSCDVADSDLLNRCLSGAMALTDPAHRICTLVKSQIAATDGALPNVLVYEIMVKVLKRYDQTFNKVLSFQEPTASAFRSRCSRTDPGFGAWNRRRKMNARSWSCLIGKRACARNSSVREAPGAGVCQTWLRRVPGMTNNGFASIVEKLIRKDICGQANPTSANVCDDINIPTAEPTNPLNGGSS